MKQAKKIIFESLADNLKTALKLLKNNKNKARQGVGFHFGDSCPIARAYDITALSNWIDLSVKDKGILKKEGWNGKIYHSFLSWYDEVPYLREIESFLKKFLR